MMSVKSHHALDQRNVINGRMNNVQPAKARVNKVVAAQILAREETVPIVQMETVRGAVAPVRIRVVLVATGHAIVLEMTPIAPKSQRCAHPQTRRQRYLTVRN